MIYSFELCKYIEQLRRSKIHRNADVATRHRLLWLKDEEIGELSTKWNWLAGECDKPTDDINVLRWTLGGPYFEEYSSTNFSSEWKKEFESMTRCKEF